MSPCGPSGGSDVGVALFQEQNQVFNQPVLPAMCHSHDIERLKGRERRLDLGAGGPCPPLIVSLGRQGLETLQAHSGHGAGVLQARRQGPGAWKANPLIGSRRALSSHTRGWAVPGLREPCRV